jgi:hypothetical protein
MLLIQEEWLSVHVLNQGTVCSSWLFASLLLCCCTMLVSR